MPGTSDLKRQAVQAALELASDTPWADLTLARIAEKAKVSLADLYGVVTKDGIEAGLDEFFDRAMLDEPVAADDPPRERLFDVIMLRFEAMETHREGVLSYLKYRDSSPACRVQSEIRRLTTAKWALIAAGLDSDTAAPARVKALAISQVIASTEAAWRRETSADFAHTMAALDRNLRKMEDRLVWWQKMTGRRTKSKSSDQEPKEKNEGETPHEPTTTGD